MSTPLNFKMLPFFSNNSTVEIPIQFGLRGLLVEKTPEDSSSEHRVNLSEYGPDLWK